MIVDTEIQDEEQLISAMRLTRDLKRAAAVLDEKQARYLVDTYYTLQKLRIASAAQVRSSEEEPNTLMAWTTRMYERLEGDVKSALEVYARSQVVGQWSLSIIGIGPVIAAGLMAHIDIKQAPSAGHIWRYAGLDPTTKWEKKQKRPWNARLKVICWKAGQSFVKFSNHPECLYGRLWRQRKDFELLNNNMMEIPGSKPVRYQAIEAGKHGKYAEQARAILTEKNFRAETEAKQWYEQGMLPPAHIEARAERWAVKIFLSHWHAVAYESYYGKLAPRPYALTFLEHVDEIAIPNWPMVNEK